MAERLYSVEDTSRKTRVLYPVPFETKNCLLSVKSNSGNINLIELSQRRVHDEDLLQGRKNADKSFSKC